MTMTSPKLLCLFAILATLTLISHGADVYRIDRTFTPVPINCDGTISGIVSNSEQLTGIIGPFALPNLSASAYEMEYVSWGQTNDLRAWTNVVKSAKGGTAYTGFVGDYPQTFDDSGWIKGTKSANGYYGAYLWYLQNRLQFMSSPSTCYQTNGYVYGIQKVHVGTLGDFAPAISTNLIFPLLDEPATTNFSYPRMTSAFPSSGSETVTYRYDSRAYYRIVDFVNTLVATDAAILANSVSDATPIDNPCSTLYVGQNAANMATVKVTFAWDSSATNGALRWNFTHTNGTAATEWINGSGVFTTNTITAIWTNTTGASREFNLWAWYDMNGNGSRDSTEPHRMVKITVLTVNIAETNVYIGAGSTNVTILHLTNSYLGTGTTEWIGGPDGEVLGTGMTVTIGPTNWFAGNYTITARSTLLTNCYDTCTVTFVVVNIKRDEAGDPVDYEILTDTSRKVLPGQKLNLRAEVAPTNTPVSNWQWSLPGKTFKTYEANQTAGTLTLLSTSDLIAQTVSFYWADTSDGRSVTCTVTVAGQSFNGNDIFNVKKPVSTFATTLGTAGLNETKTRFGLYADSDSSDGITFTGNVTVPSGFDEGSWNWVQLVTLHRERTSNTGQKQKMEGNGTSYLDTRYPTKPAPYTTHPGTAGFFVTGTSNTSVDEPSEPMLDTSTNETVKVESFVTYLMFLPPGEQTRYVPLRIREWNWSASVSRTSTGTVWYIDSGTPNQSVSNSVETTIHPTWSDNVTNHFNFVNVP